LEVTTNTQVATTLVGVVLESNHPFLDASSSFLGNGREVWSQHHLKEHAQEQKKFPKWWEMLQTMEFFDI
jgi:hypothetical protein